MKPGIQTTEWWVTLLSVLGTVLALVMDKIPADSVWAVVLGSVAAVITYILGRSWVKSKEGS